MEGEGPRTGQQKWRSSPLTANQQGITESLLGANCWREMKVLRTVPLEGLNVHLRTSQDGQPSRTVNSSCRAGVRVAAGLGSLEVAGSVLAGAVRRAPVPRAKLSKPWGTVWTC